MANANPQNTPTGGGSKKPAPTPQSTTNPQPANIQRLLALTRELTADEKAELKKWMDSLPDDIPDLYVPDFVPPEHPDNLALAPGSIRLKADKYIVSKAGGWTTTLSIIDMAVTFAVLYLFWMLMVLMIGMAVKFLGRPEFFLSLPLLLTLLIMIPMQDRYWTKPKPRTVKTFAAFKKDRVVYFPAGFKLKPSLYSPFEISPGIDYIDLMEDKPIKRTIVGRSADNIEGEFTYELAYRASIQIIGQFLNFSETAAPERIESVMEDRILDLLSRNTWESITKHQSKMTKYVSGIFGGEHELTTFEQHMGRRISTNPKLTKCVPTAKGSQDLDPMIQARNFSRIYKGLKLLAPTANDETLFRNTQRIMGAQGFTDIQVPANVTTVIAGGSQAHSHGQGHGGIPDQQPSST